MNSTNPSQSSRPNDQGQRQPGAERTPDQAQPGSSAARGGYGLPCAKCKTYYSADLKSCPVCKAAERVSPTEAAESVKVAPAEDMPDLDTLEAEREKFLREFKSQLLTSPVQLEPSQITCTLSHHSGESEAASVCHGCYDRLQERADVMEAALHMDLQEATQVIYDAVWADASDPTKTYQNAAQALLSELRRRAGISAVLGPFQPLTH